MCHIHGGTRDSPQTTSCQYGEKCGRQMSCPHLRTGTGAMGMMRMQLHKSAQSALPSLGLNLHPPASEWNQRCPSCHMHGPSAGFPRPNQSHSPPDLQTPDSGIHETFPHEQRQMQNHFIALSSALCQRGAKAPPMKTLRHWEGQPGCRLSITHQPVARLLYRHIIQASGCPKTMADRKRASALLTPLPS